ncbi:hypothetical protein CICLE_v10002980mg [Citrus x clementina]|uniref:Uncharacterized protein n=1 Tax=Citrus clementina TaxID=85681 RepID=V4SX82_CITCL|nr:hypothetical protein CICLE_v10002980mg [Citrus x clementina]
MKSALVDSQFVAGINYQGIHPTSIMSYIYVGNNDGENLTALKTFSCEEVYEGNVIDDAVSITLVVTGIFVGTTLFLGCSHHLRFGSSC